VTARPEVAHSRSDDAQAPDDPGRQESEAERIDRNLMDLLQELRVAGLGIQVLFGFLLSLPFSARFGRLDAAQRQLYVAAVVLAALATAQLSAPVAYHRILFRHHQKARVLQVANRLALGGLASVGLAISCAVWLVVGVVDHGAPAVLLGALAPCALVTLWFVLPLLALVRTEEGGSGRA